MFRKSTLLALAAIVTLGAAALVSSEASARGHGGGGGGFRGGGMHSSARMVGGSHFRGIRPIFRSMARHHHNFGFRRFTHRPHWHHHNFCGRWGWHYRWCGWSRPWIYPVVTGGVATTYAAAPTYNRCTCLTKEYTQEGAVVFKDVCTQEIAMNPPADVGPAAGPGPASYQQPPQGMAPQQTYAMPPQTYAAPQQPYAAPQGQPYPQYR